MFDIGGGELVVIILAIIVLFGPKKIPEISKMFGQGIKKIKEAQMEFKNQLNELDTELKKENNDKE